MSKNKLIRQQTNAEELYRNTIQNYLNQYYSLFMSGFKWSGITPEQEDYIMRQFWSEGTVSAFKLIDGEICFAPYTAQSWGVYDEPIEVNLINKRGAKFIPSETLINNKDVVIGYIQKNKKPVYNFIKYYVERIAEVDMVINTNLQVNKIPFMIGVAPEDSAKCKDIIERILSNEIVVFSDFNSLNSVKAMMTGAPYIIDKLQQYKTDLMNELKTYLGIDNQNVEKKERLLVDEVNSNNDIINDNTNNFLLVLNDFCDKVKEVLNIDISVDSTSTEVVSESSQENTDFLNKKENNNEQ